MTDLLKLASHHPGFRFSLQWALTDKDFSLLGSFPFAKTPLTKIPSFGHSPEIGKGPDGFPTCSCGVCGVWKGVGHQCSQREQTEEAMELFSGWWDISATPTHSASSCLPAVSSWAVPGRSLCYSLCSEKSSNATSSFNVISACLSGPPSHTQHPSNNLHRTCCCWKLTCLSPLSGRAGSLLVPPRLHSQRQDSTQHTAGCPRYLWSDRISE